LSILFYHSVFEHFLLGKSWEWSAEQRSGNRGSHIKILILAYSFIGYVKTFRFLI